MMARALCTIGLLMLVSGTTSPALGADAPVARDAWARATAPGASVGAAYLVIEGGPRPDRLVAAATDRAEMVQMHTVEEQDGMAKMRALEAVEVPAGARVVLAPKSTHLMLMGLTRPLVAGEKFVLELEFAASSKQSVEVTVRPATATDASGH
jgi:copper(I)-binding protein